MEENRRTGQHHLLQAGPLPGGPQGHVQLAGVGACSAHRLGFPVSALPGRSAAGSLLALLHQDPPAACTREVSIKAAPEMSRCMHTKSGNKM